MGNAGLTQRESGAGRMWNGVATGGISPHLLTAVSVSAGGASPHSGFPGRHFLRLVTWGPQSSSILQSNTELSYHPQRTCGVFGWLIIRSFCSVLGGGCCGHKDS